MVEITEDAVVSIPISSLIPDELPRGKRGGGGVRILSSKVFQKSTPAECLIAWFEKLLDIEERLLAIPSVFMISSESMSSIASTGPVVAGYKLGDEAVVWGCEGKIAVSTSLSLSRTWRITSASLRTSVSTGALSSWSAARIRAKVLVLGCGDISLKHL